MIDFLRLLQQNGMTPGAFGIWSGVLMFAAWWLREWRETRKLSADDREARRNGYAKQVELLMTENRSQRDDMHKLRQEYDAYRILCQHENQQLRDMMINVENELTGYKRKVDAQGIELAKLKGVGK